MTAHLPLALVGILCGSLGLIAYTDIRFGLIRNWQNLLLGASGMAYSYFKTSLMLGSMVGGVFGAGMLLAIFFIYRAARNRDGIGLGDVKFMMAAGTWVYWYGVAPLLVLASTLAVAFARFGKSDANAEARIAFGPYLAVALIVVFAVQELGLAPWSMP